MSGAYVAKPAVVIPIVVPPDWNPDWDFPGPYPPGYVPDYSLAITSADTMAVGDTLSVSAVLYDHDTFETNHPKSTSILAWTATIDDDPIYVKLASAETYAVSISSAYASVVGSGGGAYWGAEPSLTFQLSDEHNGKTLVLNVASIVEGQIVTQTKNITIGGLTVEIEAVYTFSITNADNYNGLCSLGGFTNTIDGVACLACMEMFKNSGNMSNAWIEGELGSVTATGSGWSVMADLGSSVLTGDFLIELSSSALYGCTLSMRATLSVKRGATVLGTYEKTIASATEQWLSINPDTGNVTIINA